MIISKKKKKVTLKKKTHIYRPFTARARTCRRAVDLRHVPLYRAASLIAPGLRTCSSRSCDGWVCGLGPVGASLVFGLVRGAGSFAAVLPSLALVSNMSFTQHNRGFATSFRATSSLRRETMVGGALARASAFRVGLGVSGTTIVSGLCACPSHLWISRVLTSSSSLGISSLFCRATQCM